MELTVMEIAIFVGKILTSVMVMGALSVVHQFLSNQVKTIGKKTLKIFGDLGKKIVKKV